MIDVAINVFGKEYQTALAILSLIKYSKKINIIHVCIEKKQPFNFNENLFVSLLQGLPVRYHKPRFFLSTISRSQGLLNRLKLFHTAYRQSIVYQSAWEKSDADFLFILHDDMLFSGDIISNYLEKIGGNLAVGNVGQCWNCPAYAAKKCGGSLYWDFRPNYDELCGLYAQFPGEQRGFKYSLFNKKVDAWPLPECRLNDHAALINLKLARRIPFYKAPPFGLYNEIDSGISWFQSISRLGYRVEHSDFNEFGKHAWTNRRGNGYGAIFDRDAYIREELLAKRLFEEKLY